MHISGGSSEIDILHDLEMETATRFDRKKEELQILKSFVYSSRNSALLLALSQAVTGKVSRTEKKCKV